MHAWMLSSSAQHCVELLAVLTFELQSYCSACYGLSISLRSHVFEVLIVFR